MRCVEEIVEGARFGREWSGAVPVKVRLPSCEVIAMYRPDMVEHERRAVTETGAVRCTSTLSALWEMPAGIPVPVGGLGTTVHDALRDAPGLVAWPLHGWVRREFEPCGEVTDLYCAAKSADAALRQASLLSPVYDRWAVITGNVSGPAAERIVEIAENCGVGAVALTPESALELQSPAPSVLGQPHVFRWWMVEMAYASWLTRAGPTR